MLWTIAVIQGVIFTFFFLVERRFPARHLKRDNDFYQWWLFAQAFTLMWLKVLFVFIIEPAQGMFVLSVGIIEQGMVFFFFYSFFNYWWHRIKHNNTYVWRYIHRFHHCPSKMETALIFFKHPLEIVANSLLIYMVAWFFSMPIEAVAVGLLIEGAIETFHHANVKTPKRLCWIRYIIQTPEMHLIHHQKGLHKYNYVTFLWDTVFKTARVPSEWEGEIGLDMPKGIKDIFLCRK